MSLKRNQLDKNPLRLPNVLEYPLDSALILRKKHIIKKALLLNQELISKKIALLGGSNTSEIKSILELFLLKIGIKPEFYESQFNKYYEEAIFTQQALTQFKPDLIYIHVTNKNISSYPSITDSMEDIERLLQQECNKYLTIWAGLKQYGCPVIQNNFELPQQRILGNLDAYDPRGAVHYITRLNLFFAEEALHQTNLYLNDIHYLAASLGLSRWFDPQLWYVARYALSYEAIPYLAQNLSAIMGSLWGVSKKAIVLDLDNTCWGGTIGDDGLEGIVIGKDTPLAEAFSDFQSYLKKLKERGVVLTTCSKNEPEQAKQGFRHPDTILVEEDFALFAASWEPKDKTMLQISDRLNLGSGSFVFIDDNPAERQLVRTNFPMVSVPEVGSEVINFINHIDKNHFFETVSVSNEDLIRTTDYKNKEKRAAIVHQFINYEAYLDSLSMSAEIKPFTPLYMERITQLINKTNQFNVTNKRFTLTELDAISKNTNYMTLYGRLMDCYGDFGLISALICRIEGKACHIELWVMSCRAFQRTMEHAMLDTLVAWCKTLNIDTIIGSYHQTSKNHFVAHLYERLGFTKIVNNVMPTWSIPVNEYKNKNRHIKVNND
ncbi:HAD-superfamily phosphatase, subfamily IIIC/FkbH-like domain protein [Legionella oakridgensis RV-2-2007]|nr:HAD-superfamily phosphatase, subfamily IIIC/FkbH-like domain protein [Legionella oakridgensis RV-2-2007]